MSLKESYQKRKKLYLIVGACLLILLGYGFYARSKDAAPRYTTAVVRRGDITAAVQATGTINALTTVSVGS